MKLFGISLHKPSYSEFTASAVMAVGCWIALVGLARASGFALDIHEAGALLIVVAWGAVGTRLGFRFDGGPRHAAAHFVVSALLIGVYQGALAVTLA